VQKGDVLKYTDSDGLPIYGVVSTHPTEKRLYFHNTGFRIQDYSKAVKITKSPTTKEYNVKLYQKRVIKEKQELDQKIGKLQVFLNTPDSLFNVSKTDEILMKQQLEHMNSYSRVLGRRTARFGGS